MKELNFPISITGILIIGAVLLGLFLAFFIILWIMKFKAKGDKRIKVDDTFIAELVEAYGGKENIIKVSVDNGRLKVWVDSLENVNLEALKQKASSGVFVTGNTIKTLYKLESDLIKESIEKFV